MNPHNLLDQMTDALRMREVPVVECSGGQFPSSLHFLRDYVAQSRPVLLRGLTSHWPAVQKWHSQEYISSIFPRDHRVTVALTPTGRADAIEVSQKGRFLTPAEVSMRLTDFFALLNERRPHVVPYVQNQNNSLYAEFDSAAFHSDIPKDVEGFGEECFGSVPDASNVWIGDDRSVTSMHQDWYENLYVVVTGEKEFTLVPPWDARLVPKVECLNGTYEYDSATSTFRTIPCPRGSTTPWIQQDPNEVRSVVTVRLRAGDVLYLPAMWFHQVAQRSAGGGMMTVAINYWFDMKFGPLYYMVDFLKKL